MGVKSPNVSLKLMDIHERITQDVINHGGFKFSLIKNYAGDKPSKKDFIIRHDNGYGSIALDIDIIPRMLEHLKELLNEYKKHYVVDGTDWRGYSRGVGWNVYLVYNAQADVLTIHESKNRSFIIAALFFGDEKVIQKLRCRIDDVPYIIDGLKLISKEYKKFYG